MIGCVCFLANVMKEFTMGYTFMCLRHLYTYFTYFLIACSTYWTPKVHYDVVNRDIQSHMLIEVSIKIFLSFLLSHFQGQRRWFIDSDNSNNYRTVSGLFDRYRRHISDNIHITLPYLRLKCPPKAPLDSKRYISWINWGFYHVLSHNV